MRWGSILRILNRIKRRLFYYKNRHSFYYLGKGSFINKPILLCGKRNIKIGKAVTIRECGRIEVITSWHLQNFTPLLEIEDNVNIEQGVHITCAGSVKIKKGCSISSYCMITDIDHKYEEITIPILQQDLVVTNTVIGENCFLGSGVKIMAGVKLGNHCIVGSNAVVTKSFPDYCVLVGIPAKIIKKFDANSGIWRKTDKDGNFL